MKHQIKMTTKFTIIVEVEADSKEEAEEKVWELYNAEAIDPMDSDNIDTDTKWIGYAENEKKAQ